VGGGSRGRRSRPRRTEPRAAEGGGAYTVLLCAVVPYSIIFLNFLTIHSPLLNPNSIRPKNKYIQKNIREMIIYGNNFLFLYMKTKGKMFPENNIIKINVDFKSE
jgi:hypothetical protein